MNTDNWMIGAFARLLDGVVLQTYSGVPPTRLGDQAGGSRRGSGSSEVVILRRGGTTFFRGPSDHSPPLTFSTQNVTMFSMSGGEKLPSGNQSRERILDCAARSFATYGFRHSTFEEIARDAGVSRTLLYRHFENKVDLLRVVRERALAQWAESVSREAARGDTARGALEATIGETLRFASARPDFRAFLSGDTRLALSGEDRSGRLSREGWRETDRIPPGTRGGEGRIPL